MNKIKFLLCLALLVRGVEVRGQIYINSYAFGVAIANTEAKGFLDSAGITDPTIAKAVDELVTDLKVYGIWTKMKAIYPMVGGTADTHKWNLKDPRNLDAAFRLNFVGGWTHSSTGALPNGTTGYADTYFSPSANLTYNSAHISYYSRTNIETLGSSTIGSSDNLNNELRLILRRPTNTGFFISTDNTNGLLTYTIDNSQGLFIGVANGVNVRKLFRNGTALTPSSAAARGSGVWPNVNIVLGARRSTTNIVEFDDKECSFSSIGDGLTDTEAANLYTAVQKFQTTLGRNL